VPVNLDPTFRTRRVREGYDLDEVDDFVDQVLDVLEGKTGASSSLSPEAIESYEFRVVRFRECYSMDDVDDWLDAAAGELRRAAPRQGQAVAQAAAPEPVAPAPGPVPAAPGPTPSWGADPETTQAWPAPVPAAPPVPVAATVAAAVAPAPAHARVSPPVGPPPSHTQTRPQAQDQTLGDVLAPFAYERVNGGSTIPAPRHQARPVPSVPAPSTGLHHVDIWVEELAVAVRSFGWLFERLGWTLFQVWEHGRSWQSPGQGPYVVLEASPALRRQPYDRLRQGLNHLAIAVPEHWMVDRIVAEAPDYGWRLLFSDRHPYAGGPSHYAAYLENAEGFEVEVVAS
jgi:catechol 2,3-dioxygenase-like lactoylglutathione lyase family enzyme